MNVRRRFASVSLIKLIRNFNISNIILVRGLLLHAKMADLLRSLLTDQVDLAQAAIFRSTLGKDLAWITRPWIEGPGQIRVGDQARWMEERFQTMLKNIKENMSVLKILKLLHKF